jgi:outer membrane protein assembly factor BamE
MNWMINRLAFQARPYARCLLCISSAMVLSACGSWGLSAERATSVFSPYRAEVIQGNAITKEQVEALRPGMPRDQVRDILGTPLVTSAFHGNRWDYVFTIRRSGVEPQKRALSVFFKGEELERFEGDTMPTEEELIAAISTQRSFGKAPNLELSKDQLPPAKDKPQEAASNTPAGTTGGAPRTYPPLESPSR